MVPPSDRGTLRQASRECGFFPVNARECLLSRRVRRERACLSSGEPWHETCPRRHRGGGAYVGATAHDNWRAAHLSCGVVGSTDSLSPGYPLGILVARTRGADGVRPI